MPCPPWQTRAQWCTEDHWLLWGLTAGLPLAPVTCVPMLLFLSADCSQPLDVVLLLDGSSSLPESSFDKMKSFAKAFISKANIGE